MILVVKNTFNIKAFLLGDAFFVFYSVAIYLYK